MMLPLSRSRAPAARALAGGRCRCSTTMRAPLPALAGRRRSLSTASASERVRRFYKQADVAPASDGSGRFAVTLDGRTLKTPERSEVLLPTEAAAVAVAAEWESQEMHVMPHLMPLTRLVMTAIDVVPNTRESIVEGVMPYLETDTVWFWEDPERYTLSCNLYELQEKTYTPIIDWMEERFGSRPEVTTSFMVEQPEPLTASVREWVEGLDEWQLAALDQAVRALKSMVLATALLQYRISPEEAAKYASPDLMHQEPPRAAAAQRADPPPPRSRKLLPALVAVSGPQSVCAAVVWQGKPLGRNPPDRRVVRLRPAPTPTPAPAPKPAAASALLCRTPYLLVRSCPKPCRHVPMLLSQGVHRRGRRRGGLRCVSARGCRGSCAHHASRDAQVAVQMHLIQLQPPRRCRARCFGRFCYRICPTYITLHPPPVQQREHHPPTTCGQSKAPSREAHTHTQRSCGPAAGGEHALWSQAAVLWPVKQVCGIPVAAKMQPGPPRLFVLRTRIAKAFEHEK
jgi:chaperone required for assembly of F1-ATPase